MFRIFQEILTNVGRHSNASKVRVELKIVGAHLILRVKDNGKGISREEIAGGGSLGILGMHERALVVGGKLLINGAPGKGTTVTVSNPMNVMTAKTEKPSKQS
jgi:signal transduction histidine kinase